MSGSRSPAVYTKSGGALNGVSSLAIDAVTESRGYADDFLVWNGPVAEGTVGNITLAGATGVATVTRPLVKGDGIVRLTTEAVASAVAQLEWKGQWGYVRGKRLWCYSRFALSAPGAQSLIFGLATPAIADIAAALPTAGIFMSLAPATDRDPGLSSVNAGVASTVPNVTNRNFFVDPNVQYIIGFETTRTGAIVPFVGTNILNMQRGPSILASDANLPVAADAVLSIYFGVKNGAAAAVYADIDWVICMQEK